MCTAETIMAAANEAGIADEYFTENGNLYHWLETMPCDIWDEAHWQFRHCLGYERWDDDKKIWIPCYE